MPRPNNKPAPIGALNTESAANYLGVSASYLESCRVHPERGGPPYVRLGRIVRYLREDLDGWLRAGRVTPLPPERAGDTAN